MKTKIFAVLLVFSFSFAIFSQEGYSLVETKGIKFAWKTNGDNLDVILSAPTTGWISVGFDPSNKMKDADYVLVCVENGVAKARDDFGTSNLGHKSDVELGGKDDVTNLEGFEKDNYTEVKFSIPLDGGDKFDKKLTPGKHTILLAYSKKDGFKKLHSVYGKVEIEISD
ncbi:MAG TPA: DOMON domain-containing protein [Spirochaetota bacterium]|nr:DOMON domain-containing protein [Spirochaetota bacterium]